MFKAIPVGVGFLSSTKLISILVKICSLRMLLRK